MKTEDATLGSIGIIRNGALCLKEQEWKQAVLNLCDNDVQQLRAVDVKTLLRVYYAFQVGVTDHFD